MKGDLAANPFAEGGAGRALVRVCVCVCTLWFFTKEEHESGGPPHNAFLRRLSNFQFEIVSFRIAWFAQYAISTLAFYGF